MHISLYLKRKTYLSITIYWNLCRSFHVLSWYMLCTFLYFQRNFILISFWKHDFSQLTAHTIHCNTTLMLKNNYVTKNRILNISYSFFNEFVWLSFTHHFQSAIYGLFIVIRYSSIQDLCYQAMTIVNIYLYSQLVSPIDMLE